ncbi:MAG: hypothetical protein IJD67_07345 [Clostridia bacterium]|nr:hypothetical protein [Clostridia bacterium]
MKSKKTSIKEIAVFAMLGTLMFCSRLVMALLPNIHLLGMFIIVFTVTFRQKALIPLYVYVFLEGLFAGFAPWWVPYLYVWTVLWGVTMLLPRNMPDRVAGIVYPIVCMLHGLTFGILYAPGQALLFGMNFEQTLAWIATGVTFDLLHTAGDLAAGLLVLPLSKLLKSLRDKYLRA